MKKFPKNQYSRTLMFVFAFCFLTVGTVSSQVYQPQSSSYIGGNSESDAVRGTRIQSNGNIVIAVNTSLSSYGGKSASTLNGASTSSGGTIVRLNADGNQVLSVTKVSGEVLDLAIDEDNNIYVALGDGGFAKLNSTASSLTYQRDNHGYCRRIDVGSQGSVIALNNNGLDDGDMYVYNPSGTEIAAQSGKNFTQDVAINDELDMFYFVGYRNANSGCNPVQICYMIAKDFNGNEVWRNYDWPANQLEPCDGVDRTNNMADSRAYRITTGDDGQLYAAFEVAGGNHIFRYNPKNLTDPVTVVGGDSYFDLYNSKDEHKTFFARYNPSNGDYILGQQFCARPSGVNGPANAVRMKGGDIRADENGKVYIGGVSAEGLPLTFDAPEVGNTTGGAFFMIVSSDFTEREFVTRLSAGEVHAIDVETIDGEVRIVQGGYTTNGKLYINDAIQSSSSNDLHDGNFATISYLASEEAPVGSINSPENNAQYFKGSTITINVDASSSNGISKVEFYRDEVLLGSDNSAPYAYAWNNADLGAYILRAKITDNEGIESITERVQVDVTVSAENLALNKNVTFSYQQGGNEAYKAIDGNLDTRWAAKPYPQWMEIDLGQVYDLNRTEMVCLYDRAYQYKVEVKTTETGDYTEIVDRTTNEDGGSASDPIVDTFANTPARFVKLTVTGETTGASWISIVEFRVFSIAGDGDASFTLPGKIEAEDYDAMSGIQTQATADDGGGQNVGYTDAGDWMDYSVNVTEAGLYTFTYRVASPNSNRKIALLVDGDELHQVTVPNTGNWQNWVTVSSTGSLTTGIHNIRILVVNSGWNINWFAATLNDVNALPTASITSPANGASFSEGANITIIASASDSDGSISKVEFYRGSTKLGEDATSPYSYIWNNVAAGNYSLTVKATDNNGATTTSSAKSIVVTGGSDTDKELPGTIQAEDYYTMSGIQTENTSDTGGGQNVGYIDAGDYMDYSVNVTKTGTYEFRYRIASKYSTGEITLKAGSSNLHVIAIPNTGDWQNWQTITATAELTAGTQTIRIYASGSAWNINWFEAVEVSSSVVYAINAGGNAFTSTNGTEFEADNYFTGGSTYSISSNIANTEDDNLYKSERYGNFSYSLPVSNGTYTVTLKFAEVYFSSANQRLFDVDMEGTTVESNFDIYNEAGGKNIAYDISHTVTVSDGSLDIEVISIKDNAKISAIVVASSSSNARVSTQSGLSKAEDANGLLHSVEVYPTINNGTFTIQGAEGQNVAIYSISGALLDSFKITSSKEAVTLHAPGGVYLLKIEGKSDVFRLILK